MANHQGGERVLSVVKNILNILQAVIMVITIIGYSISLDVIVPIIAVISFGINYHMNRPLWRKTLQWMIRQIGTGFPWL